MSSTTLGYVRHREKGIRKGDNSHSFHNSASFRLEASPAVLNLLQARWHLDQVDLSLAVFDMTSQGRDEIRYLWLKTHLARFAVRLGKVP